MGRGERIGSKKSSEGGVWKRNVKSDDSDEDYMLEEDETDDQSDELDSLVGDASDEEILSRFIDMEKDENVRKFVSPISRKRSTGQRRNGIKGTTKRKRITDDEEDDEDYEVEEEEEEEDVDASLHGFVDDEEEEVDASLGGFVDEEEEENVRKAARPKSHERSTGQRRNWVRSSGKRKGMANEEEDDEDYEEDNDVDADSIDGGSLGSFVDEEEEENVRKVVKEESCKRSTVRNENGTRSSRKRKRTVDDEDYNDEEDNDNDVDSIVGVDRRRCATDSGGRVSDDGEEEYNYEEDDGDEDDDDDEFTPEELDFLDEEEETISPKGKKGLVRSQKRKTGAKHLKKHQKKKRRGCNRSSRPTSSRSKKSVKKVLKSRGGRCKRRSIRQTKKGKPCSDSDFAISEPSDCDFTISEEEREQVREANEFCKRLSSKEDQQEAADNQLKKVPRRKGKEKVEAVKSDVGKQVCGICLTEEGKNTVRGTLDCCNHFFCFPCLMEWSKVESRCPLCKQRFYTISKPARSSTRIDLRNVVIHVPERDQVYQPSEEELRDYIDSYENVFCTECHEGGDDDLMLLCDLCNSPSHTYCVGLGREVPDGNWYCEGCRPSALRTTSQAHQELTPTPRLNNSSSTEPTFKNMAEIDLNITIPETPITPVNEFFISPRQQPPGVNPQAPSPVSGVGVSTLFGRRRVHRLQYLLSSNRLSHPATTRVAQSSSSSPDTPRVDVGTSYNAEYANLLHENPFSTVQNRESFNGRLSLMRGHPLAFQAPVADTTRLNSGSETITSPLLNQNVVRQQLQSLVKSHLTNLCRDINMDLGQDTFKQITLGSTHTILAACGLEHSRSEVHEIQPPICLHSEVLLSPQTSLIKGCCQGCFDNFVREVVMTIVMDVKAKAPEQSSFRNY